MKHVLIALGLALMISGLASAQQTDPDPNLNRAPDQGPGIQATPNTPGAQTADCPTGVCSQFTAPGNFSDRPPIEATTGSPTAPPASTRPGDQ